MDLEKATLALVRAAEALVLDHDTSGFLADLLDSCHDVLTVDAGGILTAPSHGRLQLLAASSHKSAELELYQAQVDEGPCVDARNDNVVVAAVGEHDLRERWPVFGEAMLTAGFESVHSSPLRWQQGNVGALNLFRRAAEPFTSQEGVVAQSFADTVSLLIMHTDPLDLDRINQRIETALATRTMIETAKGVLAQREGVAMEEAYQRLLRLSRTEPTLTDTARMVVKDATKGRRGA